jgi:hypothetical protein
MVSHILLVALLSITVLSLVHLQTPPLNLFIVGISMIKIIIQRHLGQLTKQINRKQ